MEENNESSKLIQRSCFYTPNRIGFILSLKHEGIYVMEKWINILQNFIEIFLYLLYIYIYTSSLKSFIIITIIF